jgi:hypothetical protein
MSCFIILVQDSKISGMGTGLGLFNKLPEIGCSASLVILAGLGFFKFIKILITFGCKAFFKAAPEAILFWKSMFIYIVMAIKYSKQYSITTYININNTQSRINIAYRSQFIFCIVVFEKFYV